MAVVGTQQTEAIRTRPSVREQTRVGIGQLLARIAATGVIVALALFVPAGTLAWAAGWTFLALFIGFVIAISAWLLRFDPDLLAERTRGIGMADQESWDKVLLAFAGVAFFAWLALMGLDVVRYRWSRMTPSFQALGGLVLLCSFYLFFLVFRVNTYLSPGVRVQKERAQTVVSTGPYRLVRHPMYAGFVLFTLGTTLLLGSWYGLLGAALLIAIVARRAVLEERVLRKELDGYATYMTTVRYRLVPYVW
jgi:protein-S-isoprenylcysteine O-methyltransferase Ste14